MSKRSSPHFGALLIDKPPGPSSHELVQWVRWSLGVKSVGHCGTLDPQASGLMVVLVGKATRLASRLSAQQKGYQALFSLGTRTSTDDAAGEILEQAPVSPAQLDAATSLVQGSWVGRYELAPPRYSAVRVDGVRAHKAARAGVDLQLSARPMEILRSCGLDADKTQALLAAHGQKPGTCTQLVGADLVVSKGSYVRSLALELGRQVQCPAHLALLRRSSCGPARLDHPKLLGGLLAIPHEPAKNGAPRWRIRCPGGSDKASQAQRILSALIEPWPLLELPVHEAPPQASRDPAPVARGFFNGQALPVTHPELQPLRDLCALVWLDRARSRAALLERRSGSAQDPERWAPELVLSWSSPAPTGKHTPSSLTSA